MGAAAGRSSPRTRLRRGAAAGRRSPACSRGAEAALAWDVAGRCSWERRPGGARRAPACDEERRPGEGRLRSCAVTGRTERSSPRRLSQRRRGPTPRRAAGSSLRAAALCSPVSLWSYLAAAVADCVAEREGTHICVPPRRIGKMCSLFACSVGGLFCYPKTLYVTHFGFGYGDGSAVGDSLIVVCVCVWVGAKILCHPLVTSSADKFRCSPLLTSPKQVANILYTLLCCEFEKNIYDFCT